MVKILYSDDAPPPGHQEFFSAYGQALARWADVELNIFLIYLTTLGLSSSNATKQHEAQLLAAAAAYHEVANWRSRSAMVDAALKLRNLPEPLSQRWKTLSSRSSKKAKRRNNLAHWSVSNEMDKTGTPVFYLTEKLLLKPDAPSGESRLYRADLLRLRDEFKAFSLDLFRFQIDLAAHLETTQESHAQSGG